MHGVMFKFRASRFNARVCVQVVQWMCWADSEILPASCTWVFPCMGIMQVLQFRCLIITGHSEGLSSNWTGLGFGLYKVRL
jgi:hypothetical protein